MVGWKRKDWIIILLLVLLASALRFYALGEIPPGFQFDEAYNAIDAEQVLDGNRPLFLPANAGREVLYTYWQALLVHLFGLSVYTLRLASAIFGIIAVPITYALLRIILRKDSFTVALFTSVVLAISFWHIHFSHYAIRVIMMPVLFSITFGAFWYGAHASRPRWQMLSYAVSGLFLGFSVWTHPTGRIAPFVLLVYTVWLLWQHREYRRFMVAGPLSGLLMTGGVACIVFLPLGIEFLRHPEFFLGHASEVSVFAPRVGGDSPVGSLFANLARVVGMFAVTGDELWTHNFAGRPVFDVPMAIMFAVGLAIWGWRIWLSARRHEMSEPDGDALVLLASWALVLLLPSVFSDMAPNYSRTLPALPALFVAAGLGLTRTAKVNWPVRSAGLVLTIAIIGYSGARSAYDYFVVFPQQEDVYYLYDADKLDALRYLGELTEDNTVYLSQIWGDYHATTAMMRHEYGIKSLDTSDTVVLPPPGRGAVYAFPHEQAERANQLAALWPTVDVTVIDDDFGHPLLHVVHVPAAYASELPDKYATMQPARAQFEDAPDLVGLFAESPDKQITLIWSADEEMNASLTSYIHLMDADGNRAGQVDKLPGNGSYQTTEWTIGETIIDRYYPELTDPCAAGEPLDAVVGWYDLNAGGATRPRSDADGDNAFAGSVTLPVRAFEPVDLRLDSVSNTEITEGISLLGYAVDSSEMTPGSPFVVDLYWHNSRESGDRSQVPGMDLSLIFSGQEMDETIWSGQTPSDLDWYGGETFCTRIRTALPERAGNGDLPLSLYIGPGSDSDSIRVPIAAGSTKPSATPPD